MIQIEFHHGGTENAEKRQMKSSVRHLNASFPLRYWDRIVRMHFQYISGLFFLRVLRGASCPS